MSTDIQSSPPTESSSSLVLYCLVRKKDNRYPQALFLLMPKPDGMCFPVTRFRPGEDLYCALKRNMEEDLGLSPESYYPEEELPMIENAGESPRYPGLSKRWYLYTVDISLNTSEWDILDSNADLLWLPLEEIPGATQEPNVQAICRQLTGTDYKHLLTTVHTGPSMDALASRWMHRNAGGVRVVRENEIRNILEAGDRAFNLRVADPYLPYQKQGLGFTWSFFSPRDKQDVHVHGLPAVEIYGVLEGRLILWHKPMNERGARVWEKHILEAGDWAEVDALHCHFACWLTRDGLGTVVKAAASGEMAGVGRLGVSGKTVCKDCNVNRQCVLHPEMEILLTEYQKPFGERNYHAIESLYG